MTGFVLEAGDESGAIAAVAAAARLDRRRIRKVFEQRFAAGRMAGDYVRVYQGHTSPAVTMTAKEADG